MNGGQLDPIPKQPKDHEPQSRRGSQRARWDAEALREQDCGTPQVSLTFTSPGQRRVVARLGMPADTVTLTVVPQR